MNNMDARRKQILSLIYMVGLFIFCFLFDKLGAKAGGYLMVLALVLVCFFLPFFAFLPVAIEKPLRARLSKGQVKNANGLWSVVFAYSVIVALVLSLVMATGTAAFVKTNLGLSSVSFCMPYLAPAFFFLALSRALCMYFQGKGSGLQTVIASALMIGCAVVFSYVIGNPLMQYGQKVADLLGNADFKEQYLMVGVCVGIDIASVLTFVFLLFAYFLSSREGSRNKHMIRMTEHKGDSIRIFVASFFPYLAAAVLMLLPLMLCFVMFFEKQSDKLEAAKVLGSLTGKQYLPCLALLLGMLSFVVLIVAQIVGWMKREEIRQARAGFKIGLVWILIVCGFASVCFMIFGSWQMCLVFFGATIAYFFATLLWQSGKRKSVLISIFVSTVASLTSSFLLSGMLKQADFIIFIPTAIQLSVLAFCTGFFLIKHFRFVPDMMQGFLFPIFSSVASGLIMHIIGRVIGDFQGNLIFAIVTALVGLFVHLSLCMVLQCGNDTEILNLPGGKMWLSIGNRLHLYH